MKSTPYSKELSHTCKRKMSFKTSTTRKDAREDKCSFRHISAQESEINLALIFAYGEKIINI